MEVRGTADIGASPTPHFERPVVWRANEGGQKINGQLVDDQWIYLPGSFVW